MSIRAYLQFLDMGEAQAFLEIVRAGGILQIKPAEGSTPSPVTRSSVDETRFKFLDLKSEEEAP